MGHRQVRTSSSTTKRRGLAPSELAILVAVVAAGPIGAGGCYNPSILEGGFACASSGQPCPRHLKCGPDSFCYGSAEYDRLFGPDSGYADSAVAETGGGDGKPEGGVKPEAGNDASCSFGVVAELCGESPAAGQACNAACQTGCACGRCNVVAGATTCVAPGAVKLGELCTPGANDDCEAGLVCLPETCGNGLARCYRHCTRSSQCGAAFCQVPILKDNVATGFLACDLPPRACDPIANSGCPHPALNCYLTSANDTLCDCPRRKTPALEGEECALYNDCGGGLFCVQGADGAAGARCRFTCNVAASACPSPKHCIPNGTNAKFGYCDL
jgi:hypothetical protein